MIKLKTIIDSLCLLFSYEISTMAHKKPVTLDHNLQTQMFSKQSPMHHGRAPFINIRNYQIFTFLHVLPPYLMQYFTLINNLITIMNIIIWRGLNNWFICVLILIIWKNKFAWYNLKKDNNIWPGLILLPPIGYSSIITR